jgi:hypothetical protein
MGEWAALRATGGKTWNHSAAALRGAAAAAAAAAVEAAAAVYAAVARATVPAGSAAVDAADGTAAGRDRANGAADRVLEPGAVRRSCNVTVSLSPQASPVTFSAQPRRHDTALQNTKIHDTAHYRTLKHTTLHYTTASSAMIIINFAHEQSRICISKDIV